MRKRIAVAVVLGTASAGALGQTGGEWEIKTTEPILSSSSQVSPGGPGSLGGGGTNGGAPEGPGGITSPRVNPEVVPLPPAAWAGLACLGGVFLMQMRRKK